MNYSHHYHAGSAADVFKHVVLLVLLQHLHKKEKPFFYLDTHAGAPGYALRSAASQKTLEYKNGIERLWQKNPQSQVLKDYLHLIAATNKKGVKSVQYYPGSATIARALLRPQDRMALIENDLPVFIELQKKFRKDTQTLVLNEDGYDTIKALLPPKERRGLVLIDPPYEEPNEFKKLFAGLTQAYHRFETGIYAAWYPIKARRAIQAFHRKLSASSIDNILIVEFCPYPDDNAQRLNGSGLCIINPPWQFAETLKTCLPELLNYLKLSPNGFTEAFELE
jgi:23S rRNA (adenine2030-N6)-methyltransferase